MRVSEYDQEIPQSQTADKPLAPRGRATQQSRATRKIKNKATSSLFLIKMIAKLEWTQSNAQQNIEQLQNPTMGVTINSESTTEPKLEWTVTKNYFTHTAQNTKIHTQQWEQL